MAMLVYRMIKKSISGNQQRVYRRDFKRSIYINDWSGVYFQIKIGVSAFRASFQGLTDCKECKSW